MSGKDVTPETCMQDCKRQGYRYASIKELGNDPNVRLFIYGIYEKF